MYAADFVTTVSPTYARQLEDPFFAHGLAEVIRENAYKMRGIIDGIDTQLFDPATDPVLPANFSPTSPGGKAICKQALQTRLGLVQGPDIPIIAMVTRLVGHKGLSLLTEVFDEMLSRGVQFALVGTGEAWYEAFFTQAQRRWPGKVSATIAYAADLSSLVYAGADLYLMPSISEPCGLSQMIAMRYGTVPIVRDTGGLKDSVLPYDKDPNRGLGFVFESMDGAGLLWAVDEALNLYRNQSRWREIMQRDMTADLSWKRPAQEYSEVYRLACVK